MGLRSAETVCATDYSSLLARDQLLRDVVLQVSLASDTSIDVDVRWSIWMDSLPAPLSLLSAIPQGDVSNPLICLLPLSWHELVAGLFPSTSFRSVTLDISPNR